MHKLRPNPKALNMEFKPEFIERYSSLTDWKTFKRYSTAYLRRSIRINTLKISIKDCLKRIEQKNWNLDPIPWCKTGFWIKHKERRDVGNLFEHHLGYIYVQEAASMIPPIVLNPKPDETILDMAASPGSKTTQITAMMQSKGILIANDYKGNRLAALGVNVQRFGSTNTIITLMRGQQFKGFSFDRILLDAPCSGTGTIRKSLKTIQIWNPNMVKRLSLQQKVLIEVAFNNLKEGGTLVYSTCSVEPEENEGVIDSLIKNYNNAQVDEIKDKELPGLNRSQTILKFQNNEYSKEVNKCLRIWPQDNDTEGFFVARIRKV